MPLTLERVEELEGLSPEQIKERLTEAEYAEYLDYQENTRALIERGSELRAQSDARGGDRLCNEFAPLEGYVARELPDYLTAYSTILPKEDDPPPVAGPTPPKRFSWGNKHVEMQPKPHALLTLLWCAPERRAKVIDAEMTVWESESESDGRLKSTISRVNTALFDVGSPLQLRKSGEWLTLS